MSSIFGNDKSVPGCFAKQKMTGNVKGAVFNMGGEHNYNSIVTRFSFSREDDFVAVKCLGDAAYINLFGKKPVAEMDVTLTLFLIKGKSSTGVFESWKSRFDKDRLSTSKNECSLTVGSKALVTGYATSLVLGGDASQLGLGDATVHVVSLKDR
jgi:hypothetical protein